MTWDAKKERNLARSAAVESAGAAAGTSTSEGIPVLIDPPAPPKPSPAPAPGTTPPGGKRGPK